MSERVRGTVKAAVRTSDVARPRILGLAAIGGAVGATIALLAEGTPLAATRPIARPHAKVGCASCHAEPAGDVKPASPPHHASGACKTCHGSGHGSTRTAHRNLEAKGELTCATCHAQHAGSQGITFDGARVVRWTAGSERLIAPPEGGFAAVAKGTTVPLVSLSACARCHDPTRAADPIAACVPAGARSNALSEVSSRCFDEHVRLGDIGGASRVAGSDSRSSGPACAAQHSPVRFVAWDVAREIAATTAWVARPDEGGHPWTPAAAGLAGALL
ncbi:MAG TPA: hypothetical protein VM925_31550, partial [Labilithrix sp.]|nr:hypothetical protein [Labilithrix sp.]